MSWVALGCLHVPAACADEPKTPVAPTSLFGEPRSVGDLVVRDFKLDAKTLLPNMLWSQDAKHLYLASQTGTVYSLAVPGFTLEKTRELGEAAQAMALSARGLVVGMPGSREVWLLDPATLETRAKIPAGKMSGVAANPQLDYAYVANERQDELTVLDLAKGASARQFSAYDVQREQGDLIKQSSEPSLLEFKFLTITPDGHHLFCAGSQALCRFLIDGDDLFYEEQGPPLGGIVEVQCSPDSRYVTAFASYSIHHKDFVTDICRVGDLSHVVTTVDTYRNSHLLLDQIAAKIYVEDNAMLYVCASDGTREKSYPVPPPKDAFTFSRSLSLFPGGRKLLVLTTEGLYWVELPAPLAR